MHLKTYSLEAFFRTLKPLFTPLIRVVNIMLLQRGSFSEPKSLTHAASWSKTRVFAQMEMLPRSFQLRQACLKCNVLLKPFLI